MNMVISKILVNPLSYDISVAIERRVNIKDFSVFQIGVIVRIIEKDRRFRR